MRTAKEKTEKPAKQTKKALKEKRDKAKTRKADHKGPGTIAI